MRSVFYISLIVFVSLSSFHCLVVYYISPVWAKGSPDPGDGGVPVVVPPEKEALAKELFKINEFNLVASEMMSLNRTLPDYRIPG